VAKWDYTPLARSISAAGTQYGNNPLVFVLYYEFCGRLSDLFITLELMPNNEVARLTGRIKMLLGSAMTATPPSPTREKTDWTDGNMLTVLADRFGCTRDATGAISERGRRINSLKKCSSTGKSSRQQIQPETTQKRVCTCFSIWKYSKGRVLNWRYWG
jgi:hypothetical protein